MTDSAISTKKRLLRILLGGAVLATAWLAIDLLTHSDSASAVETVDVLPLVDIPIGSDPVAEITAPIATPIAPIAAPVTRAVAPVVPAAASIVSPVLTVVEPVVAPVVAPVLDPVVTPVFETVAPILPALAEIAATLPVIPQLTVTPNLGALAAGGGLILGVALAASSAPLLPSPSKRNLPTAPEAPGGPFSAGAAVLNSAFFAVPGSVRSARSSSGAVPASPTSGFDTTPD